MTTVVAALPVPFLPPPSPLVTVHAGRVPTKRSRKTRDVVRTCDCGAEVTGEEQENPVLTIQCSKAGCEPIWVATEHESACLAAVENGSGRSTRSWFTVVLDDTVRELVRTLGGTDEIVAYIVLVLFRIFSTL
ncbi:hypothetical protein B0H17DRAFT_1145798 [Mycena rosella]|uniref:Uncharacterized protein n=1 Tax=Mycena rosella TaxID=1033263 RepID=A0AAD7CSI4_MYCRO|nr:hypothetical protein B0H17DRAFT_1145798 [Mycena rosella]